MRPISFAACGSTSLSLSAASFFASGSHGNPFSSWKKLEKGLPWDPDAKKLAADKDKDVDPQAAKEIGRIGVNFYRRNANVVYALIEHANGGIFRSDDKGETWTRASETNPRAIYYS